MKASCLLPLLIIATFAACSRQEPAATAQPAATQELPASTKDVPAGAYEIDPMHASLLFRVSHLGFSNYTARFKRFTGQLQFDPKNLAAATLSVNVDPRSIETDFPDPAQIDFNAELQGEQWLNTAQYPELTFRSTGITLTGANTMQVTGDLTLRGITKPVVLATTFNGGYAGHPLEPRARIGFSARGELKRSDFGITYGIPAAGTTMGVSDRVEVIIEAEFSGPPLAANAAAGAAG